jgi:hypothetical protein
MSTAANSTQNGTKPKNSFMTSVSSGFKSASNSASKMAKQAKLNTEMALIRDEIKGLKRAWGEAAFNDFSDGKHEEFQAKHTEFKLKIDEKNVKLQAKETELKLASAKKP